MNLAPTNMTEAELAQWEKDAAAGTLFAPEERPIKHGTTHAYKMLACRCQSCKRAKADYAKRYYTTRKAYFREYRAARKAEATRHALESLFGVVLL